MEEIFKTLFFCFGVGLRSIPTSAQKFQQIKAKKFAAQIISPTLPPLTPAEMEEWDEWI